MDFLATNRVSWDRRVAQHVASDFYDVAGWRAGATSLQDIELGLLGQLDGLEVLHLMCHFGQDTLSLARMGAQVTGVDFSPVAIAQARQLAQETELQARFVEGNVLDAPALLHGQTFDRVFLSYGTIGWLPDVRAWAAVVRSCLKPDGQLVFVEFHPALWMLDDAFQQFQYSYFTAEAIETTEGSYANLTDDQPQNFVSWNHGLAEVIGALLAEGLVLEAFAEYDYSPYNIFGDRAVEMSPGQWGLQGLERKLPLVYSLVMRG